MTFADRSVGAAAPTSIKESVRNWALVSLVLYVVNGVAFAGFTAAGGLWFLVSDVFGLLLALTLMVVVIRFDELLLPIAGSLSRTARWVGVMAMGLGAAGSIVLIISQIDHEFVPGGGGLGMQFVGWALLGIWFLMVSRMGSATGLFSKRWALAAQVAGWGSILAMAATVPMGPDSPTVSIGFTVTFVAIVVWVIWTRKELAEA